MEVTEHWVGWSLNCKEIVLFINSFSDPYKCALALINENFHSFQDSLIVRKYKKMIFVLTSNVLISIKDFFNSKGKNIFKDVKVGQ